MINFVKSEDIHDELLQKSITQEDLDYANSTITDLAIDFNIDPSTICLSPVPFKIKELAKCHVCESICIRKGGCAAPNRSLGGSEVVDAFTLKLRMYTRLINQYNNALSEETFGGYKAQENVFSIEIGRN